MSAATDAARALAPVFRDALAGSATARRRRDVLTVTWAKGKASGRCPHCETGHMEPRRARPLGGTSEADFMACVGGCGRTAIDTGPNRMQDALTAVDVARCKALADAAVRRMSE